MQLSDQLSFLLGAQGAQQGWQEPVYLANPAAGSGLAYTVPGDHWERLLAVTFQLATSAVAGQRQPLLDICDGNGLVLAEIPAGTNPGLSATLTTYLSQAPASLLAPSPSVNGTGNVTAPAAGTTITSAVLSQGTWQVNWQVLLQGAAAAGDVNNFGLNLGATLVDTSENGEAAGALYQQDPVVLDVPAAGATLAIKAIGAGTAGVIYDAGFTAVPTEGATYYGTLPDLLLPSGWQVKVNVTGIQAADQITNARMIMQRFPTDAVRSGYGG